MEPSPPIDPHPPSSPSSPPTCSSTSCTLKPLAFIHAHRTYLCLRHLTDAEEEHKIEYLHSLSRQDAALVDQVGAELVKAFKKIDEEDNHEFRDICDRVVEQLETNFKELKEIVQDCISEPWFQAYFRREGSLRESYGDWVERKKNTIDRYFDPETLLKLAFVTREAIGRAFIDSNENFLSNNNEVMPYYWQNKVREKLYRLYPKIQKICSEDKNSEYISQINPFAKPLEDCITSEDLQQNNKEVQETLNSPKHSDKNLKEKNTWTKTCAHEGCSIKAFCYIPGLNCYFWIKHCTSPCKDTYPKMYLYDISRAGNLDLFSKLIDKVLEYQNNFISFIKNKNNKTKAEIEAPKQIKLLTTVSKIVSRTMEKITYLVDHILHVSSDLLFQDVLNSGIVNSNLNSDCKDNASWAEYCADLDYHNIPKIQEYRQYFDSITTFELISMTQTCIEDLWDYEGFSSFIKNIVKACCFEMFYLVQWHHENINTRLDSNFFILFSNAIEDFKFQENCFEDVDTFLTKFKRSEYSYDTNLILVKFIEYQNLKELKYVLNQPQKIYDETSLNFILSNILTIYKKFWQIKPQNNSKTSELESKINGGNHFYDDIKDIDFDKSFEKMLNKTFEWDHSEKCAMAAFYFLPECDMTLWLLHRFDEAYCHYSKFEPLYRFTFMGMVALIEYLQNIYFKYYTLVCSKFANVDKQKWVDNIWNFWISLSLVMSETICKWYWNDWDLKRRIGGEWLLTGFDRLVNFFIWS